MQQQVFSITQINEYLRGKKIELDGVEEVHSVRLRVVKDFLDSGEPFVKFVFSLNFCLVAFLVFPVCSKSLFCNVIHAARTNLHFYPLTFV